VETLANNLNGFTGTVTEQNHCHGEMKLSRCTKEGKLVGGGGGFLLQLRNLIFFSTLSDRGGASVYIVPPKVHGK
jgi:hypothetical protein